MSSATERESPVGHRPSGPAQLGGGEWILVFRRTFKEFVRDDCVGLAHAIAYSSLLAFFPATILLIGLLGLVGAFDELKSFLAPVAPRGVIDVIDEAERSAQGRAGSLAALVIGTALAVWVASGAMHSIVKAVNRAYDRLETRPF